MNFKNLSICAGVHCSGKPMYCSENFGRRAISWMGKDGRFPQSDAFVNTVIGNYSLGPYSFVNSEEVPIIGQYYCIMIVVGGTKRY